MSTQLTSSSKFLSLILRHQPEKIGVRLDEQGWIAIDRLIENANRHGKQLTLELIHQIVSTNDKQRFALSEDGLKIRANQGHSIDSVDLNLPPHTPTQICFTEPLLHSYPAFNKTVR